MNASACPHCGAAYDASHRQTGDRVYHAPCGGWFLVVHIAGGQTELRPCDPPTTWPKERRRSDPPP